MAKSSGKVKFSKKRVKYLSKKQHLKQIDIAELLDRSIDTVKGIYRNEMILPEQLDKIGKKLDASVDYLKGQANMPQYMLAEKSAEYMEEEAVEEDRVDDEGFAIPHYNHQAYWETMMKEMDDEFEPFLNWIEDSHLLLTASGYIDKPYPVAIECIKNHREWIKQAMIYLIVYSCGPKIDSKDYVLDAFRRFWDDSYYMLEKRTEKEASWLNDLGVDNDEEEIKEE